MTNDFIGPTGMDCPAPAHCPHLHANPTNNKAPQPDELPIIVGYCNVCRAGVESHRQFNDHLLTRHASELLVPFEALSSGKGVAGQTDPMLSVPSCEKHGKTDMQHRVSYRCGACAKPQPSSDTDLREAISELLLDSWDLLPDGEAARAAAKELDWPEAPDFEGDLWVVNGESPKSLATKIVTLFHTYSRKAVIAELGRLQARLPDPNNNVEEWKGHNLGLIQALTVIDLRLDELQSEQEASNE